jgi:hypothetical protein
MGIGWKHHLKESEKIMAQLGVEDGKLVRSNAAEREAERVARATMVKVIGEDLHSDGSLNPLADMMAVMNHPVHFMVSEEIYRLLMEPVFRYSEDGWELELTVFRPLRDMKAADVHNYLLHFHCLDPHYQDVTLAISQHEKWRAYPHQRREARVYIPQVGEPNYDEMDKPCRFEYVTIPNEGGEVIRTGYRGQNIRRTDFVVTWSFPHDPAKPWHDHGAKYFKSASTA